MLEDCLCCRLMYELKPSPKRGSAHNPFKTTFTRENVSPQKKWRRRICYSEMERIFLSASDYHVVKRGTKKKQCDPFRPLPSLITRIDGSVFYSRRLQFNSCVTYLLSEIHHSSARWAALISFVLMYDHFWNYSQDGSNVYKQWLHLFNAHVTWNSTKKKDSWWAVIIFPFFLSTRRV